MMFALLFSNIKLLFFVLLALLGLGVLVAIHECGHFLFAKLFGVRTPSFSIGMGPVLVSKKWWGTEFKLSAIPFGGYLEIAGQAEIGQGDQREAHATDRGSFQVKPYWQKLLIMGGGILFNLLAAFIILVGLFYSGMPKTMFLGGDTLRPVISRVLDDSVAQKVGLRAGDEIISVNQVGKLNSSRLIQELQKNKGRAIELVVKRDSDLLTLGPTLDKSGMLGVEFKAEFLPRYGVLASVKEAVVAVLRLTSAVVDVVIKIFTQHAVNNLGSPLKFIEYFVNSASEGAAILFFFIAFLSINLAVFNLIPLPIADGGQIVFITIEAIIRRQIPEKIMYGIHLASWILVMVLAGYLLVKDSISLFWPKIKALLGI